MYETIWKPQAIGEATPTRHPVAAKGQESSRGSGGSRRLRKFCLSMETGASEERGRRTVSQACFWPPSQTLSLSEKGVSQSASERTSCSRIWDRPMDHPPCKGGDSKVFWGVLSPKSFMAVFNRVGVELSEASTASQRERRSCHSPLEAVSLAAYKKSLNDLTPILSSSMKAAVFLSLMSVEHGRLKDRHPSCGIATKEGRYRLSLLLRSVPRENAWVFTGVSMTQILPAIKSWLFSSFCCVIFRDILCSYGIIARLIRVAMSSSSWQLIKGFMRKGFLDTLQNLTRMNSFGHILNVRRPTRYPIIFRNWRICWSILSTNFDIPKDCFGRAFTLLSYHGQARYVSITYA